MAEIAEIDPSELSARLGRGDSLVVLDVREAEEVAAAPFSGAIHIPMGELAGRIGELERVRETVVVCHHGIRSAQVAAYLARMGFERIGNLSGGIDAWSLKVDPSTPRY